MIFPVAQLLSFISHKFTLSPGDLVLTGTPAGVTFIQKTPKLQEVKTLVHYPQFTIVNDKQLFFLPGVGPVVAGDVITAGLEDLVTITFPVVA